jgi:hypothetical protein
MVTDGSASTMNHERRIQVSNVKDPISTYILLNNHLKGDIFVMRLISFEADMPMG